MKGIIIYKSKYGSTKKYAEWLKEETNFELYNINGFTKDLHEYDMIIFASSIHAGSLSLKSFIVDNWSYISEKIIAVMVTSGASHEEVIKGIIRSSLPSEVYNKIHIFPVGGEYVFRKMSFLDRNIIRIVAFFSKSPDAKKGMLTEKEDVNRSNLENILKFIICHKF